MNMEIVVKDNSVHLKNVNLGNNFSNIVADLIIGKYGQVKVQLNSGLSINTGMSSLPSATLRLVSDELEKMEKNKIQKEIKKKIDTLYRNRVESELEK